MKVIVIRQPWAWLIVHGYKDIENRSWAPRYRGTLLIQASASRPARRTLEAIRAFARKRGVELPDEFESGGIVGSAQLDNCITTSRSEWFEGPIGWVLSKPKKLRFIPLKGQLGLFDPPQQVLDRLHRSSSGSARPKKRDARAFRSRSGALSPPANGRVSTIPAKDRYVGE